ncbi:MAG: hypothetical protein JF619_14675 [Massilia sp.]|nr:hypothetical protein [Massilia sp.]
MDQQKLRSLVFERTGVKIDVDDPVFAVVALNEAVLEETVERHVALIEEATADLIAQAGGKPRAKAAPAKAAGPNGEQRAMLLAAGAAVLGALLVLAGQALFFKPPPPPAPIVQAKELTVEQLTAIRNGEKLAKIVQKLDPKTRNAIQADMQKP